MRNANDDSQGTGTGGITLNLKLVGRRIKEVRTKRKMSQKTLANRADISDPYLCNIECGKKTASMDVLVRIANALDTSVDDLLAGVQQNNNYCYEDEVSKMMNDCSSYEKRIIYETVKALKKSLRDNKPIIEDEIVYSIQTNW